MSEKAPSKAKDFSDILEKILKVSKKKGQVPREVLLSVLGDRPERYAAVLDAMGISVAWRSAKPREPERPVRAHPRILSRSEEEDVFRTISDSEGVVRDVLNRFLFVPDMYLGILDRLNSRSERFDHLVGGAFSGKRDAYVSLIPSLRKKVCSIRDRMQEACSRNGDVIGLRAELRKCFDELSFKQDVVEGLCDSAYERFYLPYMELAKNGPNDEKSDMEAKFGMLPEDFTESFSELRRAIWDGRRAKEKIVSSNQRLVDFVARKCGGRGMPFPDLVQEGNLGLVNAVRKFKYQRGHKFSTYAIWWIRQAIARAIDNQSRTIRIPVHIIELMDKMRRVEKRLAQVLGRNVDDEDVAQEMGLPLSRIRELKEMSQHTVSLDDRTGEDGDATVGDFVPDAKAENAADNTDRRILKERVAEILKGLTERERIVISARYGLNDGAARTLDEVGMMFNVTRERIRQIEISAIQKLRESKNVSALAEFMRA